LDEVAVAAVYDRRKWQMGLLDCFIQIAVAAVYDRRK
jgi:hypothetical protein